MYTEHRHVFSPVNADTYITRTRGKEDELTKRTSEQARENENEREREKVRKRERKKREKTRKRD